MIDGRFVTVVAQIRNVSSSWGFRFGGEADGLSGGAHICVEQNRAPIR